MKKKTILLLLGWGISLILIAMLVIRLDPTKLAALFSETRWPIVILAAALNIAVIAFKALRWQWMMRPLAHTTFWKMFKAIMMGYAGNCVFPVRGGDVLRIYLVGRWEGVSRLALTSMLGLEKLFDVLPMLLLFLLYSGLMVGRRARSFGGLAVVVVLLALCGCWYLSRRVAPGTVTSTWSRAVQGLHLLHQKHLVTLCGMVSCATTIMMIATLLLCQRALHLILPLAAPITAFLGINLSFLIPSAPSNIGPFESAACLAYQSFGVDLHWALSVALLYHAVQVIPIIGIGGVMALSEQQWARVILLKCVKSLIFIFGIVPYNILITIGTLVILLCSRTPYGPARSNNSR